MGSKHIIFSRPTCSALAHASGTSDEDHFFQVKFVQMPIWIISLSFWFEAHEFFSLFFRFSSYWQKTVELNPAADNMTPYPKRNKRVQESLVKGLQLTVSHICCNQIFPFISERSVQHGKSTGLTTNVAAAELRMLCLSMPYTTALRMFVTLLSSKSTISLAIWPESVCAILEATQMKRSCVFFAQHGVIKATRPDGSKTCSTWLDSGQGNPGLVAADAMHAQHSMDKGTGRRAAVGATVRPPHARQGDWSPRLLRRDVKHRWRDAWARASCQYTTVLSALPLLYSNAIAPIIDLRCIDFVCSSSFIKTCLTLVGFLNTVLFVAVKE